MGVPNTLKAADSTELVSAALNEKLAAARAYQAAQKGLMTFIVDEADEATLCHHMGVLRVARAMFNNTQAFSDGRQIADHLCPALLSKFDACGSAP